MTNGADPAGHIDLEPGARALALAAMQTRQAVTPSEQLRLVDPSIYLLVVAGTVDVFFRTADESVGYSRHMIRLEPGGLAFGLPEGGEGFELRLVGQDATVVSGPLTQLSEAFNDGASGDLTHALARWIDLLGTAAAGRPSPHDAVTLSVGMEKSVEVDDTLEAVDSVVWLTQHGGEYWFLGRRPVEPSLVLPLCERTWVEAHEAGIVRGHATLDAAVDLARDLPAYHFMLHSLLVENAKESLAAEAMGIEAKRQRNAETLSQATRMLAVAGRAEREPPAAASGEPLLAAMQLVGRVTGIDIKTPPGGPGALDRSADPLGAIVEASGCEMRTVQLQGAWYKDDMGPLLGFRDEDLTPVALLPVGAGAYDVVEADGSSSRKVNAKLAAQLFDAAIMLYPATPTRPASVGDLLSLGLNRTARDVVTVVAMLVLVGAASMVMPIVIGQITGSVVQEAQVDQLIILISALVVASFASVAFTFVQSVAGLRIEGQIDVRAQAAVWNRILRLPASFFRDYTVGDLAMRALGIDAMRKLMTTGALSALLSIATGVFSLGLMFYYDWLLAAVATGVMAIYGVGGIILARAAANKQRQVLDNQGKLHALALQLLQAVAKLRVTGSETKAFSIWAEQFARTRRLTYAQQRLVAIVPVASAAFSFITFLVFVVIIALQAGQLLAPFETAYDWQGIDRATVTRVIAPSSFIAFYAAFGQLYAAVTGIVQTTLSLTMVVPLRDRLVPLLEAQPEDSEGGEDPGELRGEIEINAVEFRYVPDMALVLRGLSMHIREGEFIAVVGPSGAGKSSIIRLILGFDEPEAGSIFIDGKDISRLDKRAVRRQIGVVLQNGRLMSGSIFDNIVAGGNSSMDDAWRAARMAGFDQDVEDMPMGMHTVISEGGSTISGGQRQRLMIARAIVRQPRILIFDEATSALDNETQKIVADSLAELNCTRIAIAHRLSTVIDADRIFVIDQGEMVEAGSYDELMKLDGVFAQLAKRQIA